jgi:UDP-N-acetylmuramoyl-L-alanyl-D-glutamate--2,6-diaminopimelate ligase
MEKILQIIKKYIPHKLFLALQPAYHFLISGLAAAVYRWPSEKIIVIGITGTTGKTTSAYLIAKTLEAAGYKTGFTSTAIFNDGQREWLNDKKMTMVGRFFTQKLLREMVRNKCQYAIVETTSEGIKQFRHRFINYDILVFTGLYPEHIESHGSFENYKEAKGRLFVHLKKCKTKYIDDKKFVHHSISGLRKTELARVKKTIIANLDDKYADYFINFWAEEKLGFTTPPSSAEATAGKPTLPSQEGGYVARYDSVKVIEYGNIEAQNSGTSFRVLKTKINLQILGAYNAVNAMTAVVVGLSQGIEIEKIKFGLESISGVAGRFERIDEGQNFTVIVDYAFEPNAVLKLYETLKLIPHGKIIHILGSTGGGRDAARRPILGKIAGENAAIVIITNEDPYDDDPQLIIDQVALGAEKAGKKLSEDYFKILNREEAIEKALSLAVEGDIVLVTGKGSEQAIVGQNGEKTPWDDRAVIRGKLGKFPISNS